MTTVYVGNLHPHTTVTDLRNSFDKFGSIKHAWVARNPPGFAFVEFNDREHALTAVEENTGAIIFGREIRCEISNRKSASMDRPRDYRVRDGPGGDRSREHRGEHVRERVDPGERARDRDVGQDWDSKLRREPTCRIIIDRVPDRVTLADITNLVQTVTNPLLVEPVRDSRGTWLAEVCSHAEAARVIRQCHDILFHGSWVIVHKDHSTHGVGDFSIMPTLQTYVPQERSRGDQFVAADGQGRWDRHVSDVLRSDRPPVRSSTRGPSQLEQQQLIDQRWRGRSYSPASSQSSDDNRHKRRR